MDTDKTGYISNQKVWDVLENYRECNDLTITEMAERLEWKYQQYANIKNRLDKSMKISTVEYICEHLNLDIKDFFNGVADLRKVLNTYPPEIIRFLATPGAREDLIKLYTVWLKEATLKELKNSVTETARKTLSLSQ